MKEINEDTNDYGYTISFKCPRHKKCLAWRKFKMEVPWITYITLPDGTIVATGAPVEDLQYGNYLSKQMKRRCNLCKKRKINGR